MRKIMLIIDDFNELEFLESTLRRLGFDVLSLNKDLTVPSAILGFFPDLVMAQAKSRAVDGVALSVKVRRLAPQARMVLLHPIGAPPKAGLELKQTVDAFLEVPVDPSKLIAMLAQLGSLDEKVLQDKLTRMAAGKMSEDKRSRLQGKSGQASHSGPATNMVGGGSGNKTNQSDLVHITSRNPGPNQTDSTVGGGPDADGGEGFTKGVHHFQGTNTLKGATHITGERAQAGAAYDPSGNQTPGNAPAGSFIPTPDLSSRTSTSGRRASAANAEVTERTKKYDQFLASHDEPADKVIPQGEMRRQAKVYKLDVPTDETDLDKKREFVRALFRK